MTEAAPVDRNRQGWDIAVTIIALLLNATFLAVAGFLGLFSLSFVDVCPDGSCDQVGSAATAAFIAAIVVVVVFIAGAIIAPVLLVKKRRGWWVAVGSGVIMAIVFFVGFAMATSALTPLHEHPRSAAVLTIEV